MHQQLPKEINPLRLAQNSLALTGQLTVSAMPRLVKTLCSNKGIVDVNLIFDVDEVNTPYMRGELKTVVSMICQRCMLAMDVNLEVQCLLAMVTNEQKIAGLAEQYEPWLLDDNGDVTLSEIIEDELILALPLVPRHAEACLPTDQWLVADELMGKAKPKQSPFAVLATLKANKN